MQECNINTAVAKAMSEAAALSNGNNVLDVLDNLTPTRLLKETAEILDEQYLHKDNPTEITTFADNTALTKVSEKYGLDRGNPISKLFASVSVRPEEMLEGTDLYQAVYDINEDFNTVRDEWEKYILELPEDVDPQEVKYFEKYFSEKIGWNPYSQKFTNDSKYSEYNGVLESTKENEKISNQANYFKNFLNHLTQKPFSTKLDDLLAAGSKNVTSSLLQWAFSSAIVNSTQQAAIVSPEIGFGSKGQLAAQKVSWQKFFQGIAYAINNTIMPNNILPISLTPEEIQELSEQGIGKLNVFKAPKELLDDKFKSIAKKDKTILDKIGDNAFANWMREHDVFQGFEIPNQASAYFAGKELARQEHPDWSEEKLREAGKKFNEKVNFVPHGANVPESYWTPQGNTALRLMSYVIHSTRLQTEYALDVAKNLNIVKDPEGYKPTDTEIDRRKKAVDRLISSSIINLVALGAQSVPVFVLWSLIKLAAPDAEEWLKEQKARKDATGRFFRGGLFETVLRIDTQGSLKVNLSEFLDLTSLMADFTADFKDGVESLMDKIYQVRDGQKSWDDIDLAKDLGKILNPLLSLFGVTSKTLGIGQRQLSTMADAVRRTMTGDLERMVWETKARYTNSVGNEWARLLIPKTSDEAFKIASANMTQKQKRMQKIEKAEIKKALIEDREDDYYTLLDNYALKYDMDTEDLQKSIERGLKQSKTRRLKDLETDTELTEDEYEQKRAKIEEELFNDDTNAYEEYADEKDVELGYKQEDEEDDND